MAKNKSLALHVEDHNHGKEITSRKKNDSSLS